MTDIFKSAEYARAKLLRVRRTHPDEPKTFVVREAFRRADDNRHAAPVPFMSVGAAAATAIAALITRRASKERPISIMSCIMIEDMVFESADELRRERPDLYKEYMLSHKMVVESEKPEVSRFRCSTSGCGFQSDSDGQCPCCGNWSMCGTF
ncbi:MAG: hypothetical protein AAB421_02315 [Patescibacteria group bacterium]